MSLYQPSSSFKPDNEALSTMSRHMYIKHRNIFIGIGCVILTGLTSFVILRNYSHQSRDRLVEVRREIQQVTPGSESMFEAYHAKLKKRQAEKERRQQEEVAKS